MRGRQSNKNTRTQALDRQTTVPPRAAYTHIPVFLLYSRSLQQSNEFPLQRAAMAVRTRVCRDTAALTLWAGVLTHHTHFLLGGRTAHWKGCMWPRLGPVAAVTSLYGLVCRPSTVPPKSLNLELGNYPPGTVMKVIGLPQSQQQKLSRPGNRLHTERSRARTHTNGKEACLELSTEDKHHLICSP